jgi:hypothetical protein
MAQTSYTPISLYYSATTTNVPTAGNLVAGELALNTADGKLFYKDSSGVVQTIATKATAALPTTTTGSGAIVLATSPTVTTPIVSTTIGVGGATPSASGSGVSFPATQSASSDANTLDDYEEGTWTPTDTSGAGLTFTSITCKYTKIGRNVTINGRFSFPVTASVLGISIGGIPFNVIAGQETTSALFENASLGANQIYLSGANFDIRVAGTTTLRTNANFSGAVVLVMASYPA